MKNLLYILITIDFVVAVLGMIALITGGGFAGFMSGATPGILAGTALIMLIMMKNEEKK